MVPPAVFVKIASSFFVSQILLFAESICDKDLEFSVLKIYILILVN